MKKGAREREKAGRGTKRKKTVVVLSKHERNKSQDALMSFEGKVVRKGQIYKCIWVPKDADGHQTHLRTLENGTEFLSSSLGT